jgi:hypothetical protein
MRRRLENLGNSGLYASVRTGQTGTRKLAASKVPTVVFFNYIRRVIMSGLINIIFIALWLLGMAFAYLISGSLYIE